MKEDDIVICRRQFYNFTPGKCYCINSTKATSLGDLDGHLLHKVVDDFGNLDAISSYYFYSLSEYKKTYFSIALVRKALLDYLFRGF